jgi:hypothetical protein
MSDCSLTPTQQFISYIMVRTGWFSITWWWGLQRHLLYSQQDLTFFIWYTDNDSYLTMLYIFLLVQRHLLYSQQDLTFFIWYTDNDSYLTMLYIFLLVQSHLLYSQQDLTFCIWYTENDSYLTMLYMFYLYRGTYSTVRRIWHFLFDI